MDIVFLFSSELLTVELVLKEYHNFLLSIDCSSTLAKKVTGSVKPSIESNARKAK